MNAPGAEGSPTTALRAGSPTRRAVAFAAAATVLAALAGGCTAEPAPEGKAPHTPMIRALTLPSWNTHDYDHPEADRYLRDIAATGAEQVVLTPTWYQDDPHAVRIRRTDETADDPGLRRIVRRAHKTGLKVMLKPHVDLTSGDDRATISPPRDRADAWFTAYTRFITHYAELAADTGVAQLSVGTELAGTSRDEARWTRVIEAVRARYKGPLVYAANYDEYASVPFWHRLDLIGIDAYWPLAGAPTSDPAALRAAWRPIVRDLARFAARHDRRVLFTEAGYTSQHGTTTAPYSWTVSTRPAPDEQAAAYRALLETFTDEPWWAGVCWWMWDDWPSAGETPPRLAYSPHGKPAEDVLREFWT